MSCSNVGWIVELVCASIMFLGLLGILIQRVLGGYGLGARAIQFLAVALIVPAILILALEHILMAETIAALLGGVAGYLLSDIGRFDSKTLNKHDG